MSKQTNLIHSKTVPGRHARNLAGHVDLKEGDLGEHTDFVCGSPHPLTQDSDKSSKKENGTHDRRCSRNQGLEKLSKSQSSKKPVARCRLGKSP
jgi:hypothetical protein